MTLPLGAAEDNTKIKIGRGNGIWGRDMRAKEKKMDSRLRGNNRGIACGDEDLNRFFDSAALRSK